MNYELPNETKPAFIRSQIACEGENERPAIKTASAKKTPSKRKESADDLFELSYLPDDSQQFETVKKLMEDHSEVLSVTRNGTKAMENTFLKLRQIVNGEFLYAYTWDRAWFNRVSKNCPVEDLKFTWETLVSRLNDVLGYVCERQKYGYWWPTKKNGKMRKSSLSDFLACPMKSKNFWSPFLEIACGDCVTPRMLRSSLGKPICEKLDEILKDIWFNWDFQTMVSFYKGVLALKRWHAEVVRGFTGSENYYLSSFVQMLDQIRQCNLKTKCVGPSFIGPWSNKWSVFKSWLYKVHGVNL